ncbi:MAG: hypothetical protein CVU54_05040 [Deltaproteobacteria bacterium HGW-Deltaproteobacteria-12]|jgi:hypothetical protein|nr:MAG: hypothetical protein CVU54_05040 [Deltaproteobacteria bacterium HGW-Deltaproteobacteria-12]
MYLDTYEIASVTSFLRNDIVTQSRKPASSRRPDESREPEYLIKILDSPVSIAGQALRRASLVRNDKESNCDTVSCAGAGCADKGAA